MLTPPVNVLAPFSSSVAGPVLFSPALPAIVASMRWPTGNRFVGLTGPSFAFAWAAPTSVMAEPLFDAIVNGKGVLKLIAPSETFVLRVTDLPVVVNGRSGKDAVPPAVGKFGLLDQ